MWRLLLLAFTCANGQSSDYCGITRQHTMCRNKGLGPLCGIPGERGLGPQEQAEVVDYHNRCAENTMRDDFVSVVQVEEQSGARFDQAASSWEHAPVAVGSRVGQVGPLGDLGCRGCRGRSRALTSVPSQFGSESNLTV